jgi:hypothetical protein
MPHFPVTVSQPSSGRVKSNRTSDSVAQRHRIPIATDAPNAAAAVMNCRLDGAVIVPLPCSKSGACFLAEAISIAASSRSLAVVSSPS